MKQLRRDNTGAGPRRCRSPPIVTTVVEGERRSPGSSSWRSSIRELPSLSQAGTGSRTMAPRGWRQRRKALWSGEAIVTNFEGAEKFLHFCSRLREQASPLNPKYSPFYSGVFSTSAAASAGAERAGFSARCPRRVHATALPQALLRARDVWDACAALKRRDLAIGVRAGAQRIGAPRRGGRRGARGGVGRARTGRLRERPSRRRGDLVLLE